MRASGDFWNDATVLGMDIDLRHNNIGQDFLSVFDNGGGGFVARRFDSQDFHLIHYTAKACFLPQPLVEMLMAIIDKTWKVCYND